MAGVTPVAGTPAYVRARSHQIKQNGPNGQWQDAKIRAILRAHGYHVTASGGYNPRVHSAWMDYLLHSDHGRLQGTAARAGVGAWNAANHLAGGKAAPASEVARQQMNRSFPAGTPGNAPVKGNAAQVSARAAIAYDKAHHIPVPAGERRVAGIKVPTAPSGKPVGGGPKGKSGGNGGGNKVSLGGASPNVGSLIPTSEAGNDPKLLAQQAAAMAGTQFDPQIYQLENQIAQNPKQAAQDQADIGHWYDQVIASEKAAGASDKQAADAASSAAEAATKSIMASLGDSAGNYNIAQMGALDQGGIQAASLADQQSHNNMAPLLQQAAADASKVDQVRNNNALTALQQSLTAAQGAKGQAQASDLTSLQNNALNRLLSIQQYNNSMKQQHYQNALSAAEAAVAAQMTGAQISNLNASTRASGGHTGWMGMRADQRSALIADALNPWISKTGALVGNPKAVRNSVFAYLRGQGITSARQTGYRGPMTGVDPRAMSSINNLVNSRLAAAGAAAAQAKAQGLA